MPIKTILRWYAIIVGLILMTVMTIYGAVSFVVHKPWMQMQYVEPSTSTVDFERQARELHETARVLPSDGKVSEPNTTRVLVAERSVPLDTTGQTSAADVQDAEFDRRAKQLALKFRTANSTEQAKLRQELESLCEEHFEYRQKHRKWEIEQLSNRVDSLRLTQVTRQANKVEILKRRLNDLLDPDTNLQWDSSKTKDETTSAQIEARDPERELKIVTSPAPSKLSDSPEPTYEGKTVTQWLSLLKTERSQAKIKDALRALSHLSNDADPRTLVQAIIRMSRSQSELSDNDEGQSQNILQLAVAILLEMPSNVVIAEFLTESNEIPPQKLSGGFRSLFTTFLVSNVQNGTIERFRSSFYPRYYYFDSHNQDAFAGEIRQRSGEIVSSLTRFAQKDRSNDDWVIESAYYILGITEQSSSTYPDLIPVAERVFSNTPSTERKAISARILGESGLHTQDVLGYVKETLQSGFSPNVNFDVVIVQFAYLAETLPEVVSFIADDLSVTWKKFETDPDSEGDECDELIHILAGIGEPAKRVLPFLKSIVDTTSAQRPSQKQLTPKHYAISQERTLLHQDHILLAIKQIEEAKPKPKPEQSDQVLTLWVKDPIAKSSASTPAASVDPSPVVEKTFDGTPYSSWLKMLETERKPEKLATAMDACSRLADPQDVHRIARGIFLAAALFETSDGQEQIRVWDLGWTALQRLPADVVVEELIIALQDDDSYKSGRSFQGMLITYRFNKVFEQFPQDRTESLITELVNVIQKNGKGARSLLAGASIVWRNSKRPLNDFESLQSLIVKAVDEGPDTTIGSDSESFTAAWKITISNLIQGAPETPDLAVKLMKPAGKSNDAIELIGKLGPYAEPAVPLLVELLLEEWKLVEAERRDEANHDDHRSQKGSYDSHFARRCRIIQTIGEIGRGQNGYALLRQLCLIAPPKKERHPQTSDGQFYGFVEEALAKCAPVPQLEPKRELLSDFTLITGRWKFQPLNPGKGQKKLTAEITTNYILFADPTDRSDHEVSYFELDPAKIPKQISIFKQKVVDDQSSEIPGTRQEGIYELTETTLRMQLSEKGRPRPTELATHRANLPEGQFLLEFDRSLDDRLTKTATITSVDPTPVANPAPVIEKTFDGIQYSNWLKMLETERKPEKLATGMEACSRLADPHDVHRIARGILLAAALFETSDEKEQQLVWNAGWTALQRLPADVIAEELILALQDEVSYKSGREFQGKLIAQKVSNAFEQFPKDRTEVLIAELVKVIQKNVKGAGLLLAGASNVWRNSKRPLSDFESLRSLIFDAADSGPKITVSGMNDSIATAWKIIVSNLIKGAPETPDLGVKLMKHAGKSSEVVELIGKLGPHAEPAVPLLVDLFLEEWKQVEAERRDEANHVYHQRSNDETFRHHYRRCQIVQTIGEIGRGQNGYALLRQLILIAPPKNDRDAQFDGQLYGRVEDALAKFVPEPQLEPKPDLLSDFTLITGRWRFRAMSPGEAPDGGTAEFKRSYMGIEERDGTDFRFERNSKGFAGFRFELDQTKSPKQISLFKYQPESAGRRAGSDVPPTEIPETRMEGIYELTETTLRIQLNEPGQPRPTELVTDKANRPKRQYLLEFDRSFDEKLTKSGTTTP